MKSEVGMWKWECGKERRWEDERVRRWEMWESKVQSSKLKAERFKGNKIKAHGSGLRAQVSGLTAKGSKLTEDDRGQ